MTHDKANITSVLKETRLFPPPAEFAAEAHVKSLAEYEKLWQWAKDDPDGFWAEQAEVARLVSASGTRCWTGRSRTPSGSSAASSTPATTAWIAICTGRAATRPRSSGKASRAIRRVLTLPGSAPRGLQVRQRAEEPGHPSRATASRSTCRWCPELAIAMLACARIGAVHSVVFGGFSRRGRRRSQQRRQGQAGHHRRRRLAARQGRAAQAERRCRPGEVADRREVHRLQSLQSAKSTMKPGRDLWWHELMADASADCPAEPLDSEHPLFILYTSGSTGKPKGVLHTTAGYLLGTSLDASTGSSTSRRTTSTGVPPTSAG